MTPSGEATECLRGKGGSAENKIYLAGRGSHRGRRGSPQNVLGSLLLRIPDDLVVSAWGRSHPDTDVVAHAFGVV